MVGAIDAAGSVLKLAGVHVQMTTVLRPEQVEQTAGGRYTRWQIQVTWVFQANANGGGATY
jgi:hypothetical protein